MTSTSTSATTSASSRCPRRGASSSSPSRSRGSSRRPLDRARPLWELYAIHGLSGGRVAVMTKIHHSAVDGLSGAEILAVLLDLQPGGRDVPPCRGDEAGGGRRPSSRCWRAASPACRASRCAWRATCPKTLANLDSLPTLRHIPGAPLVASTTRIVGRIVSPRRTDGGVLEGRRLRAPRTRFQAALSPHRRVGWGSVVADGRQGRQERVRLHRQRRRDDDVRVGESARSCSSTASCPTSRS